MSKPILYSYFRSSASFRVRIALAFKGIDYDYQAVNLIKDGGEQLKDTYGQLNSMKQVPSFVYNGVTLTQSLPILEFLEEVFPENPILPQDPLLRAQARRIAEIVNSGIQPLQNLATLRKLTEITDEETKNKWAQHFVADGLEGLEKVLSETAGKFCVGDQLTIADIVLYPQVVNAARFNVDVKPFPIIQRIFDECSLIEAFQKASPSQQPDCPPELRK